MGGAPPPPPSQALTAPGGWERQADPAGPEGGSGPLPGAATLAALQRRHIEATLVQTAGRVEGPFGAARILGLNPNTLRGRMRKLGIDPRRFRPASGDQIR